MNLIHWIELSNFFKNLGTKVLKKDELNRLKSQIVLIIWKLDRIFPLAFFGIMIHLLIHLTYKAKVVDPIQYWWIYSIDK